MTGIAPSLRAAVRLNLEHLLATQPVAFYEFVMCCRDRAHVPWGDTAEVFERFSLMQDGVIHDAIREITCESVTGDGFEMALT